MKTLLICLMLLAGIKSNGQPPISHTNGNTYLKRDTTSIKRYVLYNNRVPKFTASLKNGSDTIEMYDTILVIYDKKIRYIKTKDGKVIKL